MTPERFKLAPAARRDLDEIWLFIARDSAGGADRFIDSLYDRFLLIADNPRIGRRRDELSPGIRGFPVGNYVIFYRAEEAGVEIARVLQGARDLFALFSGEG